MPDSVTADIIAKLLQSSSTVALAFGVWFGWKVLDTVKSIKSTFDRLVEDVDVIKTLEQEQGKEIIKLREILEAQGFTLRTDAFRRVKGRLIKVE